MAFTRKKARQVRTSCRHVRWVQLRPSASYFALTLLRDRRPRPKNASVAAQTRSHRIFATRALSPSRTRPRPAAHLRDANPRCAPLLYDPAPPNDQDSLHIANLAFCGEVTFRCSRAPRGRRCLTGSFNSSDNPLLPTFADPAALCDLFQHEAARRPRLFCHSACNPYRRALSITTRRFSPATSSSSAYFRLYVRLSRVRPHEDENSRSRASSPLFRRRSRRTRRSLGFAGPPTASAVPQKHP